jgi:two-component system CheB/CheR fusion protein
LNPSIFFAKGKQLQPLHILVVDDVRESADALAILIGFWGYKVVAAYNGPDALNAALANPPDVVLLDIGLPGMDGCELARRLRQLPRLAKALFVAISGYGQNADVQRCKEAGIDCHFLKPVDPIELREVLRTAAVILLTVDSSATAEPESRWPRLRPSP